MCDKCLARPNPRKPVRLQQASIFAFAKLTSPPASQQQRPQQPSQSEQSQQSQHEQQLSQQQQQSEQAATLPADCGPGQQQQQQQQQGVPPAAAAAALQPPPPAAPQLAASAAPDSPAASNSQSSPPAGATSSSSPWSIAGPSALSSSPPPAAASPLAPPPLRLPRGAAAGVELRCVPTCIVGRQFHQGGPELVPGLRAAVELEESNPRDPNALLVLCAASRAPLGHLPHAVARHLAPLLRDGGAGAGAAGHQRQQSQQAPAPEVVAELVVTETPASEKALTLVELQVTVRAAPQSAGPKPSRGGRAGGAAAKAGGGDALPTALVAALDRERLHLRFLSLIEHALPPPAQCLFLRLLQRKGPWFRLDTLSYSEVPDVAAAAAQLEAAGLARQAAPAWAEAATAAAGAGAAAAPAAGPEAAAPKAAEAPLSWPELTELLTVRDLLAVAATAGAVLAGAAARAVPARGALLGGLTAHAGRSAAAAARLHQCLLSATGPLLRVEEGACAVVTRLQRLFFLNEEQSLSQFLASDAGAVRYPLYELTAARPAFASRRQLLEYEAALGHAAQLADALEASAGRRWRSFVCANDIPAADAALQHAWDALDDNRHKVDETCPSKKPAAWVHCMMATAGVSLLERQRRHEEAVHRLQELLGGCHCPARRGAWWERLCINLESHLNRPTDALELAEAALADERLSHGDRLALRRRVLRLGKPPRRWRAPPWAEEARWEPPEVRIEAAPLTCATGVKSVFLGAGGAQVSVEELALEHYAAAGWRGLHSEGGIWATLFGLLMWEVGGMTGAGRDWQVLLLPVPDVFRSPFQTAPLDLDTDAFYPARREAIEARLARVAAGEAPSLLGAAWAEHRGTLLRGVDWERHELEELREIAECVGGPGLAAVCRLLAEDHGGWSGGMPDLLLWRADDGAPGCAAGGVAPRPPRREALLSEVKGPRDRLSDQQRAWARALTIGGLQVEVLKVVEPGTKARAPKKRRR
eukprot:scaffold9.g3277.t1